MVQKYEAPIRVYKYPFELVMAAYERRFPTCELIPVLAKTEVLSEEKSEDESTHTIERRCFLQLDAPYILKKVAGIEFFCCIQRNKLDRRRRTLTIDAWNETFQKKISVNELCCYKPHEENPDWTIFTQSASLEVKNFFGWEKFCEKLAAKHYGASVEKGKEIIEMFMTQLRDEGITFIPQFSVQPLTSPDTKETTTSTATTTTEPVTSSNISSTHQGTTGSSDQTEPEGATGGGCGDHDGHHHQHTSCPNEVTTSKSHSHGSNHSLPLTLTNGHVPPSLTPSSPPSSPVDADGNKVKDKDKDTLMHEVGHMKKEVMKEAKSKICYIYNVINDKSVAKESLN